jgi:hypothetical protein
MATKFSQFQNVATPGIGTVIVGLDAGLNSRFTVGSIKLNDLDGVGNPLLPNKGGTGVNNLDGEKLIIGTGTTPVKFLDATATGNLITGYLNTVTGKQESIVLPVGTDGEFLTADSNEPLGIKWTDIGGGDVSGSGLENEIAIFTNDPSNRIIEGDSKFTYDPTSSANVGKLTIDTTTPGGSGEIVSFGTGLTHTHEAQTSFTIGTYGSGGTDYPQQILGRGTGTIAAPTAVISENILGKVVFGGTDDAALGFTTSVDITAKATENWSVGSTGSDFAIRTIKNGESVLQDRFEIQSNGSILFNNAYTFPTGNGTTGQVLKLDSSAPGPGILSFQDESAGGVSSFNTITTDNATGEAEWDIAADGPNIFFQPTNGQQNIITLTGGTTPSDGSSGYLVLDPSQSGQFQLPPDAKINNGQVFTGGTNLVLYSWVYDGTYFYWQRDINLIDPIYAPFNPFPTQNLIGVWDPVTINPGFLLAGNPYDDAVVPDDPANAGDIAINYGVPSTGSWTNSITNSGVIDELIASTNPESTSSLYKPSFAVNGVGSLALATYNAASTPAVIVPNPTGGSVVNTQTFFTQDFNASGAGSYALSAAEITIENGSIGSGSGVTATVTSDGSDCTAIEITNGGAGYSRGDLLKLDMTSSTIGSGEIYILLETDVMSNIIPCVQFGHPTEASFGAATYNEGYDFQNTSFATAQNNILTVMMWIHGPYPQDGNYNALFDVRDSGGSSFNEALYFDGTTGYFDSFSPSTSFTDLPKLFDYSGSGGVNFYNQWTFFCFTYFPNGNSGFIATFLANQDTVNNANNANWNYSGGSEPNVAVDVDGFCTSTVGSLTLDEDDWDELSIGNTFSDEGFRAKIGKVAVYNAIVPGASILQAFNASKGYYGIT